MAPRYVAEAGAAMPARSDRIDADIVFCIFRGGLPGDADNPGLGSRITDIDHRKIRIVADQPENRRDIDDRSAAGFQHQRNDGARTQEHAR